MGGTQYGEVWKVRTFPKYAHLVAKTHYDAINAWLPDSSINDENNIRRQSQLGVTENNMCNVVNKYKYITDTASIFLYCLLVVSSLFPGNL